MSNFVDPATLVEQPTIVVPQQAVLDWKEVASRFTSRKFWAAIIGAGLFVYLIEKGYSPEVALASIIPFLGFILAEGAADLKNR